MKRKTLLAAFTLLISGGAWADELPKDTLKVVDVEEVVVIASPKENRKLRQQPTSVTLLSQKDIQANQVNTIKDLTSIVPNIFIPDYGSKLTSAIYIRGIGSRINTPSVGLYVDNVPYIDKSAFDFNYSDIERIDVLRGPQGTLYGRNTMGGLIKVHTKSPFSYQGTDLRLSAGTYNNYKASVTHYHRLSDQFAFSTGAFYEHAGGFFKNSFLNNKRVDKSNAAGGRFRGIYLPSDNLKIDISVSYEYSDQGGYPYFYLGQVDEAKQENDPRKEQIGKISYGKQSGYSRNLLNSGLTVSYQATHFTISAVTGYQNLNDHMSLDQDFTEREVFTMNQKQKLNTLSEEITLKSRPGKNWEWATGVFALYQWLDTQAPVTFGNDGMAAMEQGINQIFPDLSALGMSMALHLPDDLFISGRFKTPIFNAALYHQSTVKNLFTEKLSATIGLRLDYEKNTMSYHSGSSIPFLFKFTGKMGPTEITIPQDVHTNTAFNGKISNDYLQLLPKFALNYEFDNRNSLYATVSKGYRSGGYNIQMFSDLIQNNLSNDMRSDLKDALLANDAVPDAAKSMIIKYLNPGENITQVNEYTLYKPEHSWSYEVGTHLTFWQGRLLADFAVFCMDTRNQQVAQFAESGLGRITKNAGRSRSYGTEASVRASITNELSVNANYGYTHAIFKDYQTIDSQEQDINYNGNYVPFVPKHTLNLGAQYLFTLSPRYWLDRVQLNANINAAGRIYWTEDNLVSQSFYSTLNGRVSFEKGNGAIGLWVRNALDKKYQSFYFETMGNGLEQLGRPMQLGIEVRCRF